MQAIDNLAYTVGVEPSQLKLIILLFLSLPLSFVFPYLPPSTRSPLPFLFSAVPSFFYLCLVLDLWRGAFELLAASVVTWLLVEVGVRGKWGKTMPWIVFFVVMGHLTYNNVHTYLSGASRDTIDISGSHMVLVMKLTSFAWSAYDGTRKVEELDSTQKGSKLDKVPSLLGFLGYCFFFPSILTGPSFTYSSYESFTSHQLFLKETSSNFPEATQAALNKRGPALVPEGRRRKALKRAITGTVFLAIYATQASTYSYQEMLEVGFLKKNWFARVFFMNVAGFVARTKYYAVWCIAESAFILSGLGYNPITKKYDASRNVRIRSIELAPNFKILLDSWNVNTNVWLRENIYKRVARKGKKPGFKSTQITFITSALWHGVNPCYLMTFVLGGLSQSLGRTLRRSLRPTSFLPFHSTAIYHPLNSIASQNSRLRPTLPIRPPQTPLKWVYDIFGILFTQFVLNFIVAPFMLLSVQGSLEAWKRVGYYGILTVVIPMAVLGFGGRKSLDRGIRKRNERAARKVAKNGDVGKIAGGGLSVEEAQKLEKERIEWEEKLERKRRLRGEDGVASMGMDVEELAREEESEAESEKRKERGKGSKEL